MPPLKQKRKKELELISYDELLSSSSMTGLVSFLEIRQPHSAPTLLSHNELEERKPMSARPTVGEAPTVGVTTTVGEPSAPMRVESHQRELIAAGSSTRTMGATSTEGNAPTVGVPTATAWDNAADRVSPTVVVTATVGVSPILSRSGWLSLTTGTKYDDKRVQRVTIAQQSMSLGEERVYQALWNARPIDGIVQINRRVKSFSMGYDRLARLTRLNEKSIRDLIPKLLEKKILEIIRREDSWSRTGRTYQIYSYEEILDRQRAADLCYVVKNGRAVEFVRLFNERTVGVIPTVGESPTVPAGPTGTVGDTGAGTVGDTPTPLDRKRQATSQTSSVVREALSHYTSVDDAAIRQIMTACRSYAPDCTEDEIAHFIHEKSVLVTMRGSSIKNPMGHFIAAVPKCFEGDTYRIWLQTQSHPTATNYEDTDQQKRALDWGREHEAQLSDPNVPDEVKRVILECLSVRNDRD